jgi:Ca2+/Na+ antiporter
MDVQPEGIAGQVFDNTISIAEEESAGSIFLGMCWFLVIAFMFFAQHHTCDAYFVPAINVFVDKMKASPNKWLQRWGEQSVAGATICALGCNGPELFSNLISLYTHSDAGIGVVVGSEIFNLLVIVGCSTIFAPQIPLSLERLPFTRDVIAYAISIAMLYVALLDKKITFQESTILLGAAVVYVAAVYFTKDFEATCAPILGGQPATAKTESGNAPAVADRGRSFDPGNLEENRVATAHRATIFDIEVEVEELFHGACDVGVDHDHTTLSMHGNGKMGLKTGFVLETPDGGLLGPTLDFKNLQEITVMEMGTIRLDFAKGAFHGMIMEKITLIIICATSGDREKLLEQMKDATPCTIQYGYDATVVGGWKHFMHMLHDKEMSTYLKIVYGVPELMIDTLLRATLFAVDIKDTKKENRWPLCFAGAMFWLAFFSWCMLECANFINYYIPAIPTSFLGITVCAVGTSFPNAVASVLLSMQNKPGAAIANALGSNIQNVFLAMAMPWVIYQVQAVNFAPIPQDVAGISEGVVWMVGTLVLLVFFVCVVPPFCKLTKISGWILNLVYAVYVIDIAGETFGWWPPFMN